MGELQQQVADGAQPRARVGDVIEHGQAIPDNVVRMTDAEGDEWNRWPIEPDMFRCDREPVTVETLQKQLSFWPMTVLEVDPEPQPAWTGFVHAFLPGSDDCCNALLAVDSPRLTGKVRCGNVEDAPCHLRPKSQPVEPVEISQNCQGCGNYVPPPALHKATCPTRTPGPLVLTLPEVPKGAVALIGNRTGNRYEPDGVNWESEAWAGTYPGLLWHERPDGVTPEFAPPREPRTWPKLDPAPQIDDLPDVVAVMREDGDAWHWKRRTDAGFQTRYGRPGHAALTLSELRELGDVREVLDDGQ